MQMWKIKRCGRCAENIPRTKRVKELCFGGSQREDAATNQKLVITGRAFQKDIMIVSTKHAETDNHTTPLIINNTTRRVRLIIEKVAVFHRATAGIVAAIVNSGGS
jgi:hypothetical protein